MPADAGFLYAIALHHALYRFLIIATRYAKDHVFDYRVPHAPGILQRHIMYEPLTEQGVIFLFGMISSKLGFLVEAVAPDFPDCTAKRYVKGRGKRLQDVLIEFEPKSRDYDHPLKDPSGRKIIIVCWEHNWHDCPLEVIELRSEIKKLKLPDEFSHK